MQIMLSDVYGLYITWISISVFGVTGNGSEIFR